MNESGDIVHMWGTTQPNSIAIWLNDQFLIREGDTIDWDGDGFPDAGFVLTDLFPAPSIFGRLAIGPRDDQGRVRVYAVARVDAPFEDDLAVALVIDVQTAFCLCPADVDCSGAIGFDDLLRILSNWGPCGPDCPEDVDGDNDVGFGDVLQVLSAWGPCF